MICAIAGCGKPAVCALGVNVPGTGVPIDLHGPLFACIGLEVCDDHYRAWDVQTALSDEMRELFQQLARLSVESQGKDADDAIAPDFRRAFKSKVPFTNEFYLMLIASRESPVNGHVG